MVAICMECSWKECVRTETISSIVLVILKLDLELIATESPFAPNNYLSDPNQHIKSLPKSTRRKIVNLPEHFQLICIISKVLLVCVFVATCLFRGVATYAITCVSPSIRLFDSRSCRPNLLIVFVANQSAL